MNKYTTIILGAGVGKRMRSKTPKILHKILGKPIVSFVIEKVQNIGCPEVIVVVGKHKKAIKKELGNSVKYAFQPIPMGTGDAAKKGIVKATHNDILILNGDIPLLNENTINKLIEYHKQKNADLTILTCTMKNPYGYGRILRDNNDHIAGIVEQTDATSQQQKIKEINVGVYYGNKKMLLNALNKIIPQNKQGELYLTDIIKKMPNYRKAIVGFRINDEEEMLGINTRSDLAKARQIIKKRLLKSDVG